MIADATSTPTTGELLPHHAALIEASGITPEVAAARGYRSVTDTGELERLGFADYQRLVPGLLIPGWGLDGRARPPQFRPDHPRLNDKGKPIKYETPAGSRPYLNVPPAVQPVLTDPSIPLAITEGSRKADAITSAGTPCIGINGVWGWMGRNEHGGRGVILGDWREIALNGRLVDVIFDSDAATNPKVARARDELAEWLASRGARVRTVSLPTGPNGEKLGADDLLGAGRELPPGEPAAGEIVNLDDYLDATGSPGLAAARAEVAALKAENRRLADENAALRAEHAAAAARDTAVERAGDQVDRLAHELTDARAEIDCLWDLLLMPHRDAAQQAAAGAYRRLHAKYALGRADDDGRLRCYRGEFADNSGVNEKAASAGVRLLRDVGVVLEAPDPEDEREHKRLTQQLTTDYLTGLQRLRDGCRERSRRYRSKRGRPRKSDQQNSIPPCPKDDGHPIDAVCRVDGTVVATDLVTTCLVTTSPAVTDQRNSIRTVDTRDGRNSIPPAASDWQPGQPTLRIVPRTMPHPETDAPPAPGSRAALPHPDGDDGARCTQCGGPIFRPGRCLVCRSYDAPGTAPPPSPTPPPSLSWDTATDTAAGGDG